MINNKSIKISACFFFLWGLLHFLVGYPALLYPFEGASVVLDVFKINTLEGTSLSTDYTNAAYLGVNFLINLMAFGILGMWLASLMWKGKYVPLCYQLSLVILGIVDIAFVICMVITDISPLIEAIWGPVLYILGSVFGWYGLNSIKRKGDVPSANEEDGACTQQH